MGQFGNLDIFGNLDVKEHLNVRNRIINDDIVYLTLRDESLVQYTSIFLAAYVKKNDNYLSESSRPISWLGEKMKARPLIHWWISSSALGAPVTLTPARGVTITFVSTPSAGTMLEPATVTNINTTRTSLTDVNHVFRFQITSTSASGPQTKYFNAWVQGITYSVSFDIGGLV